MVNFIIFCLVVYRITNLFVYEHGPFHCFQKLRDFLGVREDEEPEGYFPELFSCSHCMSVMVSIVLWPFFAYNQEQFLMFSAFLAASSVVIFMYKVSNYFE